MKLSYNNLRKTSTDNEDTEEYNIDKNIDNNKSKVEIDKSNLSIDISDIIENDDDGMNYHFTHYVKKYRNMIMYSLVLIVVAFLLYVFLFGENEEEKQKKDKEINTSNNISSLNSSTISNFNSTKVTNSSQINEIENLIKNHNLNTTTNTNQNSNKSQMNQNNTSINDINSNNDDFNPYDEILTSSMFESNDFKVYKRINRTGIDFTEGLFFSSDLNLIESTGMYGRSVLKEYNILNPFESLWEINLEKNYFGEGVCQYKNYLIQLTYRENVILIYKLNSKEKKYEYHSKITKPKEIVEGWGLTIGNINEDDILFISDSTHSLKLFKIWEENDILNIEFLKSLSVTLDNNPVYNINELEFVNDKIIANIWFKNNIIVIDKLTGQVTRSIDFSSLVHYEHSLEYKSKQTEVLNGIAYNKKRNIIAITGKYWNGIYIVRIKDL